MVNLSDLIYKLEATLRAIPELVAELSNGDANMIAAYVDQNPTKSSVEEEAYGMPPGSIAIIYVDTAMTQGDNSMSQWTHRYSLFVRAARDRADGLELLTLLMCGVPQPGDGQRWYRCALMDGVLPAEVNAIARQTDREGIDYFIVNAEFQESGDA